MANTRFSRTNYLEAAVAVLKNGTGGGAPARDEITPYVMENAMNLDRFTVWKQASGAALNVDFDITGAASNKDVTFAAALGHRPTTSTGSGITSIAVQWANNAAGYPPGAWNAFDSFSMSGAARNGGIVAALVAARYVRFVLTVSDAFTLGRFYVGQVDDDLSTIFGPGSSRSVVNPRSESVSVGGIPINNWFGDPVYEFNYNFPIMLAAQAAKLETLARARQTVVYIDNFSVVREVLVRRVAKATRFIGPSTEVYDVTADLIELP